MRLMNQYDRAGREPVGRRQVQERIIILKCEMEVSSRSSFYQPGASRTMPRLRCLNRNASELKRKTFRKRAREDLNAKGPFCQADPLLLNLLGTVDRLTQWKDGDKIVDSSLAFATRETNRVFLFQINSIRSLKNVRENKAIPSHYSSASCTPCRFIALLLHVCTVPRELYGR